MRCLSRVYCVTCLLFCTECVTSHDWDWGSQPTPWPIVTHPSMSHNRCPCCFSTLLSQHHTPQSQACPHFPLKQWAALNWVQLGSVQISTRYLHVAKVDCGCVYKQPPVSHITEPSPAQPVQCMEGIDRMRGFAGFCCVLLWVESGGCVCVSLLESSALF